MPGEEGNPPHGSNLEINLYSGDTFLGSTFLNYDLTRSQNHAKMLAPGGHAVQLIAIESPEQNYTRFSDVISRLGDSQHCMHSVWLIKSPLSNALIKRVLQHHLGEDDRLIITGLSDNYAEVGLPIESTDWIWEDTIQQVGTTGAPREQLHE